ncbi:MAG: hypothetical protein L6413_05310 [Coriobacteriia bacterium]|nr:hypothetical protein [Coriobacteriia bacterium]
MTDIRRGATSPESTAGSFAPHERSAPQAELVTETNFERLQREALITDPGAPGFNPDLDWILPGTRKSYRDLVGAGIDPNDTVARDAFIEREMDEAIGLTVGQQSPTQLVTTLRGELPVGATLLLEETDQGGRWLQPVALRLADGTRIGAASADDAGVDWDHIEWAASNIRGYDHPSFVETDRQSGFWELPPAHA